MEKPDSAKRPALPGEVESALSGLNRFEHLEIGELGPSRESAPEKGAALCPHCGRSNEPERLDCWACSRLLAQKEEAPADLIHVVLDGVTYKSTDPNLPDDIAALIERVRKEGYSPQLLEDWRKWRVNRGAAQRGELAQGRSLDGGINVFKGQRVSVIKIDGKVYTSDDPSLTDEFKELFRYIDEKGVTPALMEFLRKTVPSVDYHPPTTAHPNEGDLAFWNPTVTERLNLRQADIDAVERGREEAPEAKVTFSLPLSWIVVAVIAFVLIALFR